MQPTSSPDQPHLPTKASSTERLYHTDSYLRTCEARVVAVDGTAVALDRTIIYPGGGGQLADQGMLIWGERRLPVTGLQVHDWVDLARSGAGSGWPAARRRRDSYLPARLGVSLPDDAYTHRAAPALRHHLPRFWRSGHRGPDVCRPCPNGLCHRRLHARVDSFRRARRQRSSAGGLPHQGVYAVAEQAFEIPGLIRTKINLLPPEMKEIRIVEIVGLDLQADGGTHVHSTREVGGIKITKTENKGKQNKRMEIVLLDTQ